MEYIKKELRLEGQLVIYTRLFAVNVAKEVCVVGHKSFFVHLNMFF